MELLKTQGFVLIDVDVVALNNAGASATTNFDNGVATKTISKNGKKYAYVSGQAWRYWWRDTLKKILDGICLQLQEKVRLHSQMQTL
jgi:CRISPR-associated protein Cst2